MADRRPAWPWPCGLNLAPGMAPRVCSERSNYFAELEPRYGIEP